MVGLIAITRDMLREMPERQQDIYLSVNTYFEVVINVGW